MAKRDGYRAAIGSGGAGEHEFHDVQIQVEGEGKYVCERQEEKATAEVQKYAAKELKLLGDHREAVAMASAAELSAGDALLDAVEAESANAAIEQIVRAKSSVAAIEASIRACRARRLEAIKGKIAVEAADWRRRADEARAEQDRITAKTKKHVDALKQLEGVEFIPASTPKSSTLGARAFGCEDKAVQLETASVPRNGGAQLDDVTSAISLVEMVLRHESDGPSAQEVSCVGCGLRSGRPLR